MCRHLIWGIIVVFCWNPNNIHAQYEWQDPLHFKGIDLGGKYMFLVHVGGAALSSLLTRKDGSIPESERWRVAAYLEYQQSYEKGENGSGVLAAKARLGYQLRKWILLGAEGQIALFKSPEVRTGGTGGSIFFNWFFVNSHSFDLFFDNGFGILLSGQNFPDGGTSFNFTTYYGVGMNVRLASRYKLFFGVRNMHISNAFLFGEDRNPAFDSIGGVIGVVF